MLPDEIDDREFINAHPGRVGRRKAEALVAAIDRAVVREMKWLNFSRGQCAEAARRGDTVARDQYAAQAHALTLNIMRLEQRRRELTGKIDHTPPTQKAWLMAAGLLGGFLASHWLRLHP